MADLPELSTITDVTRALSYPIFGNAEPTPYLEAYVTLDDGSRLGLSQYRSEYPDWGVDSFIKANGFPVFVHGAGARSCIVKAIDLDHAKALNAHVLDKGLGWEQ